MSEPYRQCASVLITNRENRILFVHQSYGMRLFGLPGGVVDVGETPPMAAIREALEEANVEIEIEYQLGAYLLTGGGMPDIFASVFKGHIVKGEPKADLSEISDITWCTVDDLPRPLLSDAEAAIEDFAEGRRGVVRTCQRTTAMVE